MTVSEFATLDALGDAFEAFQRRKRPVNPGYAS